MKTIWWINGCMNQWTNHSMNHWINDSNSPWINHWTNESIISNAMKHWANKPINQWINNPAKDSWTNERVNEFDGWVDGWVSYFSLLSYFFTERPLRWGTSSLSYFFSEQPLIWATSTLICLPASSSAASATHFFCLCSCYNAFNTLQLQSRLPGVS